MEATENDPESLVDLHAALSGPEVTSTLSPLLRSAVAQNPALLPQGDSSKLYCGGWGSHSHWVVMDAHSDSLSSQALGSSE